MKTLAKVAGVALVAGMFSLNSQAAAIYCSASAPIDIDSAGVLSVTDFTYRGDSADDCYGVVAGNDSEDALNTVINVGVFEPNNGVFGFDDWVFLTKYESEGVESEDFVTDDDVLSFSLVYNGPSGGLHRYALNVSADPATLLPANMMLAGVIKQSNDWSAYLFREVTIESLNEGTFLSVFGQGNNDFSHFTFYGRNYSQPDPDPGRDPNPVPVPVPGTLVLLGLGLLGLGWSRKRRPLA